MTRPPDLGGFAQHGLLLALASPVGDSSWMRTVWAPGCFILCHWPPSPFSSPQGLIEWEMGSGRDAGQRLGRSGRCVDTALPCDSPQVQGGWALEK